MVDVDERGGSAAALGAPGWQAPPMPSNEAWRQHVLDDLQVLDTPPDETVDALTRLVREQLGVQTVLVSLVDRERQWFKSCAGGTLGAQGPRSESFCGWAILDADVMVISDALQDDRFVGNPNVTGGPRIRFYAGVPLLVDGHAVGTLCALHDQPRLLTQAERRLMLACAQVVVRLLRDRLREDEGLAMGRLLEASVEEAYLFDLSRQRILYASEGAAQRMGSSIQALRRLAPRELSARYEAGTVVAALSASAAPGGARRQRVTLEIDHRRPDGTLYPVSVQLSPVPPEQAGGREGLVVVVASDARERRQRERELAYRAHHDALTGLANRYLLEDHFEQACQRAGRDHRLVGLAVIDLDGFKAINDTHGHAVGDAVLVHVGEVLRCAVRRHDTVARLGGDEFVVLFDGLRDEAQAREVHQRVVQALREHPCEAIGQPVAFSAGLRLAPSEQADLDNLLEAADAAMYVDKDGDEGPLQAS